MSILSVFIGLVIEVSVDKEKKEYYYRSNKIKP